MRTATLSVEGAVSLSYTDTGAPSGTGDRYTTIFSLNGMGFSERIFDKISRVSLANYKVRFVSVARRHYSQSSPYTNAEMRVVTNGTEEEKQAFMDARGRELAMFWDTFIQDHHLPEISKDGSSGGILLLGWSLGCSYTLAAISAISKLPVEAQSRLSSRIRGLVLYEPAPIVIGLPSPPRNWTPLVDTTMPEELRIPMFTHWVTGYFDHGDLSTRDLERLSYVLPVTNYVPSIFNMSAEEKSLVVSDGQEASIDMPLMVFFIPQQLLGFRTAVFDTSVRKLLHHMKVLLLIGESSPSFAPAGLWAAEEQNELHGGGLLKRHIVPNGNHFMHWDMPQTMMKVLVEFLGSM